jgi:bifunctional non-homologous end joining protein LigD
MAGPWGLEIDQLHPRGDRLRLRDRVFRSASMRKRPGGLAVVADGSVVLFSRDGADITRTLPEIAAALSNAVGWRAAILDGEILASDAEGVPSFSRLQRRWPQCRRPGAELLREVPVRVFVFDILTCDGENVASRSYVERRDALTARIGKSGTVQVPPSWADVDPAVILGAAEELRPEGIVCKRLDTALGKDAAAEAQPIRDW